MTPQQFYDKWIKISVDKKQQTDFLEMIHDNNLFSITLQDGLKFNCNGKCKKMGLCDECSAENSCVNIDKCGAKLFDEEDILNEIDGQTTYVNVSQEIATNDEIEITLERVKINIKDTTNDEIIVCSCGDCPNFVQNVLPEASPCKNCPNNKNKFFGRWG